MADQSVPTLEKATFAGGCFWCMEPPFEKLPGVVSVVSGYTGGKEENPTYEQVGMGRTGHTEAIQITYDSSKVTYPDLLDVFWRQIDPTDAGGQFADRGRSYRTAIFFHNDEQKRMALESKALLEKSGRFTKPIVTEIVPAGPFYPAETTHQDYYKKNPLRYKFYRSHSGRDSYLEGVWNKDDLKKRLSPLQFKVTQEEGTEPAFDNAYWDNKRDGIYVDIVSGEPLFSSTDKFDSGTGWPSFTRPLIAGNIVEREDRGLFMARTEVRSQRGDSHLGHVFPDGPRTLPDLPTGQAGGRQATGLRYCINSASLRFVPKEDLEKEGYGEFKKLFP